MKTCEICGTPYETNRPNKVTCSDECSYELKKKRSRDRSRRLKEKFALLGLSLRQGRALKKAGRRGRKCGKKVRVFYDKGLWVDWRKEELEKIKIIKDRANV